MDFAKNALTFINEPVPKFFFEVLFIDRPDSSKPQSMLASMAKTALSALNSGNNGAFSDIDGLNVSFATTPVNEAGWSSPRPTFDKMVNEKLTLTRYVRPRHVVSDLMTTWCSDTMDAVKTWNARVTKKDIIINIYHPMLKLPAIFSMGPSGVPIAAFNIIEAFPVTWKVDALSSTDSGSPLKETIELGYTEIKRLGNAFPAPF